MNSQIQQISVTARRAARARDWTQVKACAREILKRQRDSAEGRFLLGLAEKQSGRGDQALDAFVTAIRLDKARYDAATELAELYMQRNRYGEAAHLLGRYESRMSNSPLYLDRAAKVYMNIGLPERAWVMLRKANELQPGVELIQAHLAECAVFVGEIDEAKSIYRGLLEKYPDHQKNHYELAMIERAKDDAHVEEMKAVLERTQLIPALNIFLYYAIGKELEDLERWDEAFEYYGKAGDAARSEADYDVETDVVLIDKVIEVCSADWLASNPPTRTAGRRTPIFIIGLPRSGTTLTERILSSHSKVESVGESFFLRDVIRKVSGVRTSDTMSAAIMEAAGSKKAEHIAEAYLEAISYRLGDAPMFIEKLPENILFAGFIAKAFPDCKIVLQVRNPMDSCFSLYKQSYFRYAYSLDDLGRYYVAYDRLVRHWREVLDDRLIEVEYEAMVADFEKQTRELLHKIGLKFEDACLNFEKNVTATNTASTVQVREKAHTRSVRRWTRYEKQLQSLRDHLESAGIDVG